MIIAIPGCTLFGSLGGIADGSRANADDTNGLEPSPPSSTSAEAAAPVIDAAVTPPSPEPQLLQSSVAAGTSRATTLAIPLMPTKAGSLIVVVVAEETGTTLVSSMTDDVGNVYVSTNHRSVDPACDDGLEIWFASDIRPGATGVTVRMEARVELEAWAIEFTGVRAFDKGATLDAQPEGTIIRAPAVAPTSARALVVSAAMTCGDISGLRTPPVFEALPIMNGHNVAFSFSTNRDAAGAIWNTSPGTWNATTVVFQ